MKTDILNIQAFDATTASEKEWDDIIRLQQAYDAELEPDDPPSIASVIRRNFTVQAESERFVTNRWLVYDQSGKQAIAYASAFWQAPSSDDYESKKHLASYDLYVSPSHRRQGIGRQVLQRIIQAVHEDGRSVMESWVSTSEGDAFMSAMGAEIVLQMKSNRLHLAELDWEMVERWANEGAKKNPNTELYMTDTIPPDNMLTPLADLLMHIFQQIPKEGASGFPEVITPDSIRLRYDQIHKQQYTNVNIFTREADGTLSAMTDIIYQPDEPHVIHQGLTGVHLDARGRGLGKWLKATMLLEVRNRYPDTQFIDTHNANVNEAMLHINNKLGFKFHKQNSTYKLLVDDILTS